MAGFDRSYRQKVIDEYLNDTGRNIFAPVEFLAWLKERPQHRVYPVFFGKSDEEAAAQWRLQTVRQFVSGLRIVVRVSDPAGGPPVSVRVPAFISPVSTRKSGSSYVQIDVNDEATSRELARQAALDLRKWLDRYGGIARINGLSVAELQEMAAALEAAGVAEAA